MGGELFYRITNHGPYRPSRASKLILTVTSALSYLHSRNIVHRDLKPENILFRTISTPPFHYDADDDTDLDVVIADFGDACAADEHVQTLTRTCGTVGYMAPEMLLRIGHGQLVYVCFSMLLFFPILPHSSPSSLFPYSL
jgi:calcium/calmodulin-dependent protein kinase I